MFASLDQQLANVRRWNDERGWGFSASDIESVDLTPGDDSKPLVVDVIAVYLDDSGPLSGVRRTCHELWRLAAEEFPNAWSWDWYWDEWRNRPKPVRLLDGIVHRPGVRRVTLDLGAHWRRGRQVRAIHVRGRNSAHAEILAAAAHFPRWLRSMDGVRVPYTWLAGYQVTIPERSIDYHIPCLSWSTFRQTLSLTADWAHHAYAGWAAPTCTG